MDVKGINTQMFENYTIDILAPAVAALDQYPITLVLDKATIHNVDMIKQAFIDGGCQDVAEVVVLPTQAAKRMSPLDNCLFRTWKQNVMRHGATTYHHLVRLMNDEWTNLSAAAISSMYHHSRLFRGDDVYSDCPNPCSHQHTRA